MQQQTWISLYICVVVTVTILAFTYVLTPKTRSSRSVKTNQNTMPEGMRPLHSNAGDAHHSNTQISKPIQTTTASTTQLCPVPKVAGKLYAWKSLLYPQRSCALEMLSWVKAPAETPPPRPRGDIHYLISYVYVEPMYTIMSDQRRVDALHAAGWKFLFPSAHVLHTFSHKASFAETLTQMGLGHYLPKTYTDQTVKFPAFIKSDELDINYGQGVRLVNNRAQLRDARKTFGPNAVLQEAIPSEWEYTSCLLSYQGEVHSQIHFEYLATANQQLYVWPRVDVQTIIRKEPMPGFMEMANEILTAFNISGFTNFGFKPRADGSLALLEINPRFSLDLLQPFEQTAHLEAYIRLIDSVG
eukprot:TRINITY_DN68187_c3_g2_i3.p1 TRINITY_DN68187_c3_g2~~TRINITY_DN68187_c3_g2_i3.p1  ORF type:complete len:357 (+),score=9.77 TRINITY_DN68187_c3_g2_i3:35-1105(+)